MTSTIELNEFLRHRVRRRITDYVPAEFIATPECRECRWRDAEDRVVEANILRAHRRQRNYEPHVVSAMEIALCAAMLGLRLRPQLQAPVGPFDVDFLFPDERLIVEVDGHGWHDGDYDGRRDNYLNTHGYTVMRIPGARVFQNPMRCAREIAHRLEQMTA